MGHSKYLESEIYLLAEQIQAIIRAGGNIAKACEEVGVPEHTYRYWRKSRPDLFAHLEKTHSSREATAVRRLEKARHSISRLRGFIDENLSEYSTDPEQIQEKFQQLDILVRDTEWVVQHGPGPRGEEDINCLQVKEMDNTSRSYEVTVRDNVPFLIERGQGKQSFRCNLFVYWKAAIILERLWSFPEGFSFPELMVTMQFQDRSDFKDYELRVCLRFWIACQLVVRHKYRYRAVSHQLIVDLKNSSLPYQLSDPMSYQSGYIERIDGAWAEAVLRMHSDRSNELNRLRNKMRP